MYVGVIQHQGSQLTSTREGRHPSSSSGATVGLCYGQSRGRIEIMRRYDILGDTGFAGENKQNSEVSNNFPCALRVDVRGRKKTLHCSSG